jgi:ribosomal protein S27E
VKGALAAHGLPAKAVPCGRCGRPVVAVPNRRPLCTACAHLLAAARARGTPPGTATLRTVGANPGRAPAPPKILPSWNLAARAPTPPLRRSDFQLDSQPRAARPAGARPRPSVFEQPPSGMSPVRCFRCGRRGVVPSRPLLSRPTRDILCPSCSGTGAPRPTGPPVPAPSAADRPKALLGRPPLIMVRSKEAFARALPSTFEVRCFGCGRVGHLPVRPEVSLRPGDLVCPTCRANAPRSGLPVGSPSAPGSPVARDGAAPL